MRLTLAPAAVLLKGFTMHAHQQFIDAAKAELEQRGFAVGQHATPIDEAVVIPFTKGTASGYVTASAREISMNASRLPQLVKARCETGIRQAEAG
jgi:hypothetical protein